MLKFVRYVVPANEDLRLSLLEKTPLQLCYVIVSSDLSAANAVRCLIYTPYQSITSWRAFLLWSIHLVPLASPFRHQLFLE